jgi:anti-sigma factor RsiW
VSAPSDELLMRYFDGELDADEARAVEAWLESSPDGKLMLLGWGRVGDAVRAIGDDVGAAGADIVDSVMAHIDAAPKGASVRALGRRGPRRWMAAVPAIGLSVAAAAAVAIYLRPPASPSSAAGAASIARVTPEQASSPAVDSASAVAVASADLESGASIESVDFGAIGGSIFMVPNGQSSEDSETPVVWLMDDAAPDEGRMAPL